MWKHFWWTDINGDLRCSRSGSFFHHMVLPPPFWSSGASIMNSPSTGPPVAPCLPLLLVAHLTSARPILSPTFPLNRGYCFDLEWPPSSSFHSKPVLEHHSMSISSDTPLLAESTLIVTMYSIVTKRPREKSKNNWITLKNRYLFAFQGSMSDSKAPFSILGSFALPPFVLVGLDFILHPVKYVRFSKQLVNCYYVLEMELGITRFAREENKWK